MDRPTDYGESFADVYDDWYGDLSDPTALVDAIAAALVAGAPLLELGVGTGRLALPLRQVGVAVTGLDASLPMLAQWQAKAAAETAGTADVPAVAGDMAALPFADHTFDGVLIAYNTFFNLADPEQQRRCLRDATRVVRPGGFLVLEAFVPVPPPDEDDQRVVAGSRPGVFIATRQRPGSQLVDGAHITFDDDGIRTRPWRIRPVAPAELDAMAAAAGLMLERRTRTWEGDAFNESSDTHVSWYRSLS